MSFLFYWPIIFLVAISSSGAYASFKNFSKKNCINTNFDISISHPAYPLGLTHNVVRVKKDHCEILVSHEKLKFIKNNWLIDVCRIPIHIKKKGRSVDIVKRMVPCNKNSITKDNFCSEYFSIKQKIQDDGLIFAKGEKENLNAEHGKIYCAYTLLESYLAKGQVLSRYHKVQGDAHSQERTMSAPYPETKTSPAPSGYPF